MGGRGASLSNQMCHHYHRHNTNSSPVDLEDINLIGSELPTPAIVMLDLVLNAAAVSCSGWMHKVVDGLARASKASNPFDIGIVSNCKDFWKAGWELGVEYETLYDVPIEGFKEVKIRRERDEMDEGLSGSRKPGGNLYGPLAATDAFLWG